MLIERICSHLEDFMNLTASSFTLNPNQLSCGVGTIDANGAFGPFEMEMASYTVWDTLATVERRTPDFSVFPLTPAILDGTEF